MWQTAGRSANALCFTLLVDAELATLHPIAAAASALAAGYCGYRRLKAKAGGETCVRKLVIALEATAAAAAGGAVVGCGWAAPGLAVAAACIAHLLDAFFAQHRDLMFDMRQEDGWTEPQVTARDNVSSS